MSKEKLLKAYKERYSNLGAFLTVRDAQKRIAMEVANQLFNVYRGEYRVEDWFNMVEVRDHCRNFYLTAFND